MAKDTRINLTPKQQRRRDRNRFIFRFFTEKQLNVTEIAKVYSLTPRHVRRIIATEKARHETIKKLTGKEPIL
jgi:Mor family transcriptional regulator